MFVWKKDFKDTVSALRIELHQQSKALDELRCMHEKHKSDYDSFKEFVMTSISQLQNIYIKHEQLITSLTNAIAQEATPKENKRHRKHIQTVAKETDGTDHNA